MNENKEEIVYGISKEAIQQHAEDQMERELSDDELEAVIEKIYERGWEIDSLVIDSINEVVNYNALLEKNEGAEKRASYFKAYWKNANAYEPEFKHMYSFKEKADVDMYVKSHFMTEYDQWKITRVDKDGEFEVEIIGQGRVD